MTRTDILFLATVLVCFGTLAGFVTGQQNGKTLAAKTCPASAVSSVHEEDGSVWCFYSHESTYGQTLIRVKGKRS